MTDRSFTYLMGGLWLLVVIAAIVAIVSIAHAADMGYCQVYATRSSAEVLRRLIGIPFVDETVGRFAWRKAYTYCLNSDEDPPIIMTPTEAPLLELPPGSVPATDKPEPKPRPEPTPTPAPKAKSTDQALCISHHMRTVYSGKHWNCRK